MNSETDNDKFQWSTVAPVVKRLVDSADALIALRSTIDHLAAEDGRCWRSLLTQLAEEALLLGAPLSSNATMIPANIEALERLSVIRWRRQQIAQLERAVVAEERLASAVERLADAYTRRDS